MLLRRQLPCLKTLVATRSPTEVATGFSRREHRSIALTPISLKDPLKCSSDRLALSPVVTSITFPLCSRCTGGQGRLVAVSGRSAPSLDATETQETNRNQWCPRQDSNLRTRLRRPMLYPLSYEGGMTCKGYRRLVATGAVRMPRQLLLSCHTHRVRSGKWECNSSSPMTSRPLLTALLNI